MKIEFGCGATPTKKGFKTCDIRDVPGVDFVCSALEIGKHVDANTVDEIFSRHFFEHLSFGQGKAMLRIWKSILKPSGKCEMILPNMSFHIQQWQRRSSKTELDHAKAGFWGWQRDEFTDTWDMHKSGYDNETMKDLLEEIGFDNIQILNPPNGQHLHAVFFKKGN